MVRMVFLHCFRAALLMLILTSAVSHAASDSLKNLPAQIDVNISWNIDKGSTNRNGSLLMQIAGTMELDPRSVKTSGKHAFVPVMLHYSLDGLTGYYNYQDALTEKNPPRNCRPLISTYKGIGKVTTARGSLMRVNRMKHLTSPSINKLSPNQKQYFVQIPGQELLLDYYDLTCGFAAQPSTVPGKSRSDHDCSYSDRKKSIGLGNILLGFKIPDSGEMKSHRKWTAHANSKPSFAISLADLPEKMRRPAYKPAESPVGNVTYNVTWAFGKAVKPIDVELRTVSFKYDSQNKKSLQLLYHAPRHPIEPPEWVRGATLNEPSAFVREHPFHVKAVFDCHRPVEAADEFRADEKVLSPEGGKGFGGELEQVGDLKISDERISGEFIIKTPQNVIGTHKVQWEWEGKIKFKDEPGEITVKLGMSEHTIHIVGKEPTEETNAYKYAVELGCEWAKGTTGDDTTFFRIWEKFLNIPAPPDCPSGGILAYKHKTPTPPGTTNELLDKGEGICGAWADFFKDTVGIHGIKIDKIGVYPKNAGKTIPGKLCFDNIVAIDAPAQGNLKPARVFTEHVLNKFKGIYYDPSYHVKSYGSLKEYENMMFHGYCRSQEVFVTVDQKDPNNKYHRCGKLDNKDSQQRQALIADCLIEADDDGTACVPNDYYECEVEERPVWP